MKYYHLIILCIGCRYQEIWLIMSLYSSARSPTDMWDSLNILFTFLVGKFYEQILMSVAKNAVREIIWDLELDRI